MAELAFNDKHNICGILDDTHDKAAPFREIIQFLRNSRIAYAITTDAVIYEESIREFWGNAEVVMQNEVLTIRSVVQGTEVNVNEEEDDPFINLISFESTQGEIRKDEGGSSDPQNQVKVGGVVYTMPEMSQEYLDYMRRSFNTPSETRHEGGTYRLSTDDLVQDPMLESINIKGPLSQEDLSKSPLKETQQTQTPIPQAGSSIQHKGELKPFKVYKSKKKGIKLQTAEEKIALLNAQAQAFSKDFDAQKEEIWKLTKERNSALGRIQELGALGEGEFVEDTL